MSGWRFFNVQNLACLNFYRQDPKEIKLPPLELSQLSGFSFVLVANSNHNPATDATTTSQNSTRSRHAFSGGAAFVSLGLAGDFFSAICGIFFVTGFLSSHLM